MNSILMGHDGEPKRIKIGVATKGKDKMGKNRALEPPFSKLIQVGVVVKELEKTVERLSS